jgi:iron complex outermembrane recepter protein
MRMLKRKSLALIVAQAVSGGSLIAASTGVMGQITAPDPAAPQQLERMTVTGSSIRRTQTEGALPVLTLDRAYIDQSGATTATELIQNLPQVQNFVANSASVNGAGAGTATAALHALPSKYTLVLIDGQRLPPTGLANGNGGGFGVNINSIPLDAIDHVEILLDGATAVYGSDAIAGVVNFILKKNTTVGNVYAEGIWPEHAGAQGYQAGISKGWGDLEKDGWNINGSYRFVHQSALDATQRSFSARGAFFPFSFNGTNYIYNGATSNTEPANITFQAKPAAGGATQSYTLNPFYNKNGNCGTPFASVLTDPATLGAIGQSCRFNYASTVQDLPAYDQQSFLAKGYLKIGKDATAWAMIGLSDFDTQPRFAPSAQPLGINNTTRLPILYNTYVQPFLTANGLVNASGTNAATIGYRAVSQGGRTDDYDTKWSQYAIGIDGHAAGWDYNARISSGISKFSDWQSGGYLDGDCFNATINSGLYDPVLSTGSALLKPCILGDKFQSTKSTLNSINLGAQHDFFELPGGPTILALGAEFIQTKFSFDPSDLAKSQSGYQGQPVSADTAIGGGAGAVPVGASRDSWAVFGEWFFPITKTFEATASVRYDYYDKTHSNFVFGLSPDDTGLIPQLPDADLGNTFSKTTGKISLRWLPIESLLLRGSYGTGFRAPAMSDIAGALAFNGSTSGSYACPFPGSPGCLPGSAQYDLLAGPNGLSGEAGLKPETSNQYTVGGRWEPIRGLSLGLDYWNVKIKNQVLSQGIAEQVGFANPQQYAGLFVNPYIDPVGGFNTIAFSQLPFNGGQANYSGVDWDFTWRTNTAWGVFNANWTGTQMLQAQYNFGPGQDFNSDLGKYGPDQQVVFRTTMQIIGSLQTGPWLNSLTFHWKSHYQDSPNSGANIFFANPDGSLGASAIPFCCLTVPSYYTFDWQTAYNVTNAIKVTVGITNLFDKDPPLSLQASGGGNQVGYDGRYADPIGRAFYLKGQYKF